MKQKTLNYSVYLLYNVLILIITLWVLLYALTFLNDFFIPNKLKWNNNKIRESLTNYYIAQAIVLLIETTIILFIVHRLNTFYEKRIIKAENPNFTASIITVIDSLVIFSFVIWELFCSYTK